MEGLGQIQAPISLKKVLDLPQRVIATPPAFVLALLLDVQEVAHHDARDLKRVELRVRHALAPSSATPAPGPGERKPRLGSESTRALPRRACGTFAESR